MAPDKKTGSKNVIQAESIRQAVVIADNFNRRFSPLTIVNPAVLLPLVNCPLIDYTLECLRASNFQEVIIFCSKHGQKVKEYINSSRWSKPTSGMKILVTLSESCYSLGDAMRDIDTKLLIRGDFVLLYGDVVSNARLLPILDWHKEKKKVDRGSIMTQIYTVGSVNHKTRSEQDSIHIAYASDSMKLLHQAKVKPNDKVTFPLSIFEENTDVNVRYDVIDTQICICSKEVASLFTDNFDCQSINEFIKGILGNEEVSCNSIYVHLLTDEYAARVNNFYMYGAVSNDILNRWVYPITPDLMPNARAKYRHYRRNVYLSDEVNLMKDNLLQDNVLVGNKTTIGQGSSVSKSVIGNNCKIGKNVKICNSYIWDNVTIDDGCVVEYAILADGVTVKKDVTLPLGCVLSYNVVVDSSMTLCEDEVRSIERQESETDADVSDFGKDYSFAESSFVDRSHSMSEFDDDEFDDDGAGDARGEDDGARETWKPKSKKKKAVAVKKSEGETSGTETSDDEAIAGISDDLVQFEREVYDSVQRGLRENIKGENLILEINSSKYAYNVTMNDVNSTVMGAVLDLPYKRKSRALSPPDLFKEITKTIEKLQAVFANYLKNVESQMDCLDAIRHHIENHPETLEIVAKLFTFLYNKDIVSEDAIMKWYQRNATVDTETAKKIKEKVLPLIRWLQEAEEESSTEDDS